ncbi:hypothetical protein HPB47_009854 [Ixodes persulcatus]|uniref:Uncharacterized protein n=1 Tax=Ixodes persulcatus TaxID=34615 RepID=A0AC60P0Q9_IXOPE|nr:hypothetical protein HPB47_009854 [Ixodes persulcatus]
MAGLVTFALSPVSLSHQTSVGKVRPLPVHTLGQGLAALGQVTGWRQLSGSSLVAFLGNGRPRQAAFLGGSSVRRRDNLALLPRATRS